MQNIEVVDVNHAFRLGDGGSIHEREE